MLSIFSKLTDRNRKKDEDPIELELKRIESELPSVKQMSSVCERLKRKDPNRWTENDRKLWDQHGCR
jgi:hypothetical protein